MREFNGSWLLLGHQSELKNDEDAIVRTVAGFPFVIATSEGFPLRFCLEHLPSSRRATSVGGQPPRAEGLPVSLSRMEIRIGDGRLTRAPDFGASCPDLQLSKVAVAVRSGLIFCNTDPQAPEAELDRQLSPLFEEASALAGWSTLVSTTTSSRVRPNGWKTYAENYLEGYHIPYLHPGLMKGIRMGSYRVAVQQRVVTQYVDTRESSVSDGYWASAWPNLAVNIYESD